jgi:hypothetical protein
MLRCIYWQSPDGTWFETFAVPGYEGFDNPIGNRSNATQTPAAEVLASRGLCTVVDHRGIRLASRFPQHPLGMEMQFLPVLSPYHFWRLGRSLPWLGECKKLLTMAVSKRIAKYRPPAASTRWPHRARGAVPVRTRKQRTLERWGSTRFGFVFSPIRVRWGTGLNLALQSLPRGLRQRPKSLQLCGRPNGL